jgi:hypothetical protein
LVELDRVVTVVAEEERPGTRLRIDADEDARALQDGIDSGKAFSSRAIGDSNVVLTDVLELERRGPVVQVASRIVSDGLKRFQRCVGRTSFEFLRKRGRAGEAVRLEQIRHRDALPTRRERLG